MGHFIVFEGPDGTGKSTIATKVADLLKQDGFDVLRTFDPGDTKIGQRIREILLDKKNDDMSPATEILLYCAARAQMAKQIIKPALDDGKVIICDRYTLSTFVYQVLTGAWTEEQVRWLIDFGSEDVQPHMMLVLHAPLDVCLGRMNKMGKEADRLESKGRSFFEAVHKRYMEECHKLYPSCETVRVNANMELDDLVKHVHMMCKEHICRR